jgi:hypothetical protein
MSIEVEATEPKIESPCKPEKKLEQNGGPVKKWDAKDAEDSYDDLSFVDVDGLMDVDLDEGSSSSPATGQHVPCTTQESKVPLRSQASRTETQKRSPSSTVQGSRPVVKRERFLPCFRHQSRSLLLL